MSEAFMKIDGEGIDVEDLTLDECEELEEYTGETMASGELQSAKAIKFVIYLFLRRKDSAATIEDAGKVTLAEFSGEEKVEQGERPTGHDAIESSA